jgi:hypothetical protein
LRSLKLGQFDLELEKVSKLFEIGLPVASASPAEEKISKRFKKSIRLASQWPIPAQNKIERAI